jgi:hypothetical protein
MSAQSAVMSAQSVKTIDYVRPIPHYLRSNQRCPLNLKLCPPNRLKPPIMSPQSRMISAQFNESLPTAIEIRAIHAPLPPIVEPPNYQSPLSAKTQPEFISRPINSAESQSTCDSWFGPSTSRKHQKS